MPSKSEAGVFIQTLLTARTATGTDGGQASVAAPKTYQAAGTTTAGAGAVSVDVQGSNDTKSWDRIGTISLTLATASSSDSFTSADRYAYVRGNVTSISGTGASVDLVMSA